MPLLSRKTEDEKAAEIADRDEHQAVSGAHVGSLPKFEYRVKWIQKGAQKGAFGSATIERILNKEGAQGWELVGIEAERATFKRPLP